MATDKYRAMAERFDASPYARFLGMRILKLSDRYVKLAMMVEESHLNFAGLLHGGVTMSLADQAFACATNTLDGLYVAVQFNMNLFSTARPGEEITAECRVIHAGKSIGVSEITVANSSGKLLAKATGTVARMKLE